MIQEGEGVKETEESSKSKKTNHPSKIKKAEVSSSDSISIFEPEPLPDDVAATDELNPRQAARVSPTKTRPVPGKPTSTLGNADEGIATDQPEPSQEQITDSSPAANPDASKLGKRGRPTLGAAEMPGGSLSEPPDENLVKGKQTSKKSTSAK